MAAATGQLQVRHETNVGREAFSIAMTLGTCLSLVLLGYSIPIPMIRHCNIVLAICLWLMGGIAVLLIFGLTLLLVLGIHAVVCRCW